jgi:hypothetical protein
MPRKIHFEALRKILPAETFQDLLRSPQGRTEPRGQRELPFVDPMGRPIRWTTSPIRSKPRLARRVCSTSSRRSPRGASGAGYRPLGQEQFWLHGAACHQSGTQAASL